MKVQAATPQAVVQVALDLQVGVDYQNDHLDGVARLTLENRGAAAVRRIPLLLNRLMSVSEARDSAGRRLALTQRVIAFADDPKLQVDFAEVELSRPLPARGRIRIAVRYSGTLVGYVETGSLYIQDHIDTAFTILRADAFAFPVVGRPSWTVNRAMPTPAFTFQARITVPKGLVAVTGGEFRSRRDAGAQVTWEYGSSTPVPFLNIAIARYVEIEQRGIRAYVFPQDSADAWRTVAKANEALDSLARWFGDLDEGPRVTLIEIPEGWGSQASLTAGIIQTASAFRDASRLHELYHELSHFWNPVDTAAFSPRLNEGLASFLERRLAGALDGWTGLDSLAGLRADSLRERSVSDSGLRTIPLRAYGVAQRTDLSYPVGMLLFYSLQHCLGAPAFDVLWRDYLRKTRHTGGSDLDFVAFASEQSGRSEVRTLFDTWFFTTHWLERLQSEDSAALLHGCEPRR